MPYLDVDPLLALMDAPLRWRAGGFMPGAALTMRAHAIGRDRRIWQAEQAVRADVRGDIIPGQSADALIWSMQPTGAHDPAMPPASIMEPLTVALELADDRGVVCAAASDRLWAGNGVQRLTVSTQSGDGVLFLPPGGGPFPTVMLIACNGRPEGRAALLASHGIACLIIVPPDQPVPLPLEWFLPWRQCVRTHPALAGARFALLAQGHGTEAALLLAGRWPEVAATVAYAPLPVRTGRLYSGAWHPRWSENGQGLDYLERGNTRRDPRRIDWQRTPVVQAPLLDSALDDLAALARARIDLSPITGAVLLLHGTADAVQPAARLAHLAADALGARARLLNCPDAGHGIGVPLVPTTDLIFPHPVTGKPCTLGGSADGLARANAVTWPVVLKFLREHLA